jgi:hypothetical protein
MVSAVDTTGEFLPGRDFAVVGAAEPVLDDFDTVVRDNSANSPAVSQSEAIIL